MLQALRRAGQQPALVAASHPWLSACADAAGPAACCAFARDFTCSIASSSGREPLYPTHVPLGPAQKAALSLGAALGALRNPARGDLVGVLGETTGWLAFREMRDRMRRTPEGRAMLLERPRVTNETADAARRSPPGSFGAAYAAFMDARGFEADDRPPVRFVDDPELAWVAAREREVHDFWHTLFECDTNLLGEAALKAVEAVQTGMPMTALSVVAGAVRLPPARRQLLLRELLPWALRAGSRCEDLMCIYYERHFEEDVEELRQRWRIIPAPQLFGTQRARQPSAAAPAGSGADASSSWGGGAQGGSAPAAAT